MEIYKINQISLNQPKTQLSLCYNHGIRTYQINDYSLKTSSNSSEVILGEISVASLLYELNIIVFTGSEHNEKYSNKKLVVYDLTKHKEIYYTLFKDPITDIKSISKYIFITSSNQLSIFSYSDLSSISLIRTLTFANKTMFNYQLWTNQSEKQNVGKIYLLMLCERDNNINIFSYFDNEFEHDQTSNLISSYKTIQNFFYDEMYKLIFIVEGNGQLFTSYSSDKYEKMAEYYRGKNIGVITSICGINNNYIAAANLDKTIHIFSVTSQKKNNITTFLYNFINPQSISSSLKIRFSELIQENENDFYSDYFKKKGSILVFSKETNSLNVICYNGFAYVIKINYNRLTYDITERKNIIQENLENMGASIEIGTSGLHLYTINKLETKEKIKESWKII